MYKSETSATYLPIFQEKERREKPISILFIVSYFSALIILYTQTPVQTTGCFTDNIFSVKNWISDMMQKGGKYNQTCCWLVRTLHLCQNLQEYLSIPIDEASLCINDILSTFSFLQRILLARYILCRSGEMPRKNNDLSSMLCRSLHFYSCWYVALGISDYPMPETATGFLRNQAQDSMMIAFRPKIQEKQSMDQRTSLFLKGQRHLSCWKFLSIGIVFSLL